jgi:hypothetical protein
VQQHNGIALSHLHVSHVAAEDVPPLLLVWKRSRDHMPSSSRPTIIGVLTQSREITFRGSFGFSYRRVAFFIAKAMSQSPP